MIECRSGLVSTDDHGFMRKSDRLIMRKSSCRDESPINGERLSNADQRWEDQLLLGDGGQIGSERVVVGTSHGATR